MIRASRQSTANSRFTKKPHPLPKSTVSNASRITVATEASQLPVSMVSRANHGDHPLIFEFLRSTTFGPSENDFEFILNSPTYEPNQRLIIRDKDEIIAHMRFVQRDIRFGLDSVPTFDLTEIALLPELRNTICLRLLLASARQIAIAEGINLLTTTYRPDIVAHPGWASIRNGSDRVVSPRDLLAGLEKIDLETDRRNTPWQKRYTVRPWRYVEQADIIAIYEKMNAEARGVVNRSGDYWHWILGRRAFDRAYVVTEYDGTSMGDARKPTGKIQGYVLLRRNQVVELAVDPDHPGAGLQLLRRASLDALEKGNHSMLLCAANSPGYRWLDDLNARLQTSPAYFAASIPSIYDFLLSTASELFRVADGNGLATGTKLGIVSGSEMVSIEMLKKKIRVKRGASPRSRIYLAPKVLTQMALAAIDPMLAIEEGLVSASTRTAIDTASKLFSKSSMNRMPLDDLAALG